MNLENNVKDVLNQKINDGTVEKLVGEAIEKGIKEAVNDLFSWGGEAKNAIEDNLKSVIVPYIERYDFSEYTVKVDAVLTEVVNQTAGEHKRLLDNFKELMTSEDLETVKTSEIFKKYCEFVSENIDTGDLEIDYDDEVTYEYITCTMEFEEEDHGRSWVDLERAVIYLECEKDEELNRRIDLVKFRDGKWNMSASMKGDIELSSLKHLSKFDVFIHQLKQNFTDFNVDECDAEEEVEPKDKPEPSFY